jgi:ankyrin repeat protein
LAQRNPNFSSQKKFANIAISTCKHQLLSCKLRGRGELVHLCEIVNGIKTLKLKTANWSDLIQHIGYKEVNKELDTRVDGILHSLQDLVSLVTSDRCLVERISALRDTWLSARDQYERSILHIAATNGNTRLVRALVYFGAFINARDGIGQTPLTLAIHKGHYIVAKFLVKNGASVREDLFLNTIPPLEIAKAKKCDLLIELL